MQRDEQIFELILDEQDRQIHGLELIASENFVSDQVMAVAFVDDILFWSTDEAYINELGNKLRREGLLLEQEDNAAGFLGVPRLPRARLRNSEPSVPSGGEQTRSPREGARANRGHAVPGVLAGQNARAGVGVFAGREVLVEV